jgi:hypothetical protein
VLTRLIQGTPRISKGSIEYEDEYRDAEHEYGEMQEQQNEPKS